MGATVDMTTYKEGIRFLLSSSRSLPTFIIPGAQKAGTSSLFAYLGSHPRIAPAIRKEVHFFDENLSRGTLWYRSHFPHRRTLASAGAITGESSPYYLYHPHVPQRMAALVPDVKLIVCLRNPVDRAISHYWHEVNRTGAESLSMKEAFAREEERIAGERERVLEDERYESYPLKHFSYLDRGLYADQLERLTRFFDRGQILVLRSEDLFTDPQQSYDEAIAFLGLQPHVLENARARNVGRYEDPLEPDLRARLEGYFEPHNRRLYDFLGVDTPWW